MSQQIQNELKLDILQSLARSQKAIAAMIESTASVMDYSTMSAEDIIKYCERIVDYQKIVAEKMLGLRVNEVKTTAPGSPWLNKSVSNVKVL